MITKDWVLFLDDVRMPHVYLSGDTLSRWQDDGCVIIWAKDIEMAKFYIEHFDCLPRFMYLDHDLGECNECNNAGRIGPCVCPYCAGSGGITTMEFLHWLSDRFDFHHEMPPKHSVISANPVGRANIVAFMNSWHNVYSAPPCEGCGRKDCVCNEGPIDDLSLAEERLENVVNEKNKR
jgi:hypothetical protein